LGFGAGEAVELRRKLVAAWMVECCGGGERKEAVGAFRSLGVLGFEAGDVVKAWRSLATARWTMERCGGCEGKEPVGCASKVLRKPVVAA
jgi:hypothetical protein